jgi:hypothetical protein
VTAAAAPKALDQGQGCENDLTNVLGVTVAEGVQIGNAF